MINIGQFDYKYAPLPPMQKYVHDFSDPKSVPVHLLYQYMKAKTIKRKLRKELKYKIKQQKSFERSLRKKASDWTPPEASSILPEFLSKSNVFISGIWRLLTGIWRLLLSLLGSHMDRHFGLFKLFLVYFNVNYIILNVR